MAVANPDGKLLESDSTNNSATVGFLLSGTTL
jgi:hypothetical protein